MNLVMDRCKQTTRRARCLLHQITPYARVVIRPLLMSGVPANMVRWALIANLVMINTHKSCARIRSTNYAGHVIKIQAHRSHIVHMPIQACSAVIVTWLPLRTLLPQAGYSPLDIPLPWVQKPALIAIKIQSIHVTRSFK